MNSDFAQTIWHVILTERSWSWAVIGLAYLLPALLIRSICLSPLIRHAKELDRKPYEAFKSAYLKRAFIGWFFFFASFVAVCVLWIQITAIPVTLHQAFIILGTVLSYLFSILCHIEAIGIAALVALRKLSEKD